MGRAPQDPPRTPQRTPAARAVCSPARAVLAALVASELAAASAIQCQSDLRLGSARNASKKGFAVDDATLRNCPGQVLSQWPNAEEPMTSIRLFKAWDTDWDESGREDAWDRLRDYVVAANATVLIGTEISCDEEADLKSWEWTKQLLQKLNPSHVMGLAIGNELELLQFKGKAKAPEGCIKRIWDGGYFWRMFQWVVSEFDAMGFGSVPVTSVFTAMALDGAPFYEQPGRALVTTFLTAAAQKYGSRFAFTWNLYPYFDAQLSLDEGSGDKCSKALASAACWGPDCLVPATVRAFRQRMEQLTGTSNSTLWIGETGWSAPKANTLSTVMSQCPDFSSAETLRDFYKGFLAWDLEVGESVRPPDHVFWFTMRDSHNFDVQESFGMVSRCNDTACKIRSPDYEPRAYEQVHAPAPQPCAGATPVAASASGEEACRDRCTLDASCGYYVVGPELADGRRSCALAATCELSATNGTELRIYKKMAPRFTADPAHALVQVPAPTCPGDGEPKRPPSDRELNSAPRASASGALLAAFLALSAWPSSSWAA